MVNLDSRLAQIRKMVDRGQYFCINKGRQYGKTTTLKALKKYLDRDYIVINMDFQMQMSHSSFANEKEFVKTFSNALLETLEFSDNYTTDKDFESKIRTAENLVELFYAIRYMCKTSKIPYVLLIDEVDQASNNQIFLDFLAQLRGYYLRRDEISTFQSVILAGVHDIRNLRQKIRSDGEHKHNSPWNIAAAFEVEMSFFPDDIAGMLEDYENDKHTGMDIPAISQLIYDYTSGYPVLVSYICKLNDEKIPENIRWTREGIVEAVGIIITSKTPLFESLVNKLEDDETLNKFVYEILINGGRYSYNPDISAMNQAMMYGFVKSVSGSLQIANRIFETRLYNMYLNSQQKQDTQIYKTGTYEKNQFITNGRLDMDKILERFVVHFNDIFGDKPEKFKEEQGREHFLLYLRPIINGVGNFYVEAQTRDHKRMDVVVDYLGEQFIIELKIWRGEEYNLRGENQLCGYLDRHHLDKGYLVSFSFNEKKESGVHTVQVDGKTIVEAIV